MARRKTYPPAKTANKRPPPPGSDASTIRPNLATIDVTAGVGRSGLAVGDRVRIGSAGLYAGETAVVERIIPAGPIPSALVRTDAGRTRRARTIDLVPIKDSPA